MQGALEEPMDNIKQKVDNLIQRFKSDDGDTKEYKRMKEMQEPSLSNPVRPRNELREEEDMWFIKTVGATQIIRLLTIIYNLY